MKDFAAVTAHRGETTVKTSNQDGFKSRQFDRFPPLQPCRGSSLNSSLSNKAFFKHVKTVKRILLKRFRMPLSIPWIETSAFVILILGSGGSSF